MYISDYVGQSVVWLSNPLESNASGRWHLVEELIRPGRFLFKSKEIQVENIIQMKGSKILKSYGDDLPDNYWARGYNRQHLVVGNLKRLD
jgi:hypothetical protein